MADWQGFHMAMMAYKKHEEKYGLEPKLTGFENLTPEKLFSHAYASGPRDDIVVLKVPEQSQHSHPSNQKATQAETLRANIRRKAEEHPEPRPAQLLRTELQRIQLPNTTILMDKIKTEIRGLVIWEISIWGNGFGQKEFWTKAFGELSIWGEWIRDNVP
ncbi:hypothetical protein V9T40_000828 [Parthenolecanium corni]|uniref:Uncharacterized protein n=1 Tax=Parthenolecanium corni TaxID=536013 RepID=A0AAN9Y0T7_9HEMI